MASKCTKCGNEDNYNFVLNIGLCNPCIGERIEELEKALEKAKAESELEKAANKCARTGNRTDLQAYLKMRRDYL